jgi:hypothetical protein
MIYTNLEISKAKNIKVNEKITYHYLMIADLLIEQQTTEGIPEEKKEHKPVTQTQLESPLTQWLPLIG